MADKTIIATGATVTFGTSGFTMYLDSISLGGVSREAINVSHMGTTGNHIFTPADLVDQGTVTLNGHFNPDNTPPTAAAAETITITWPIANPSNSTNGTWAASGFCTAFNWDAVNEEKATATCELKISGGWTISAEAV